MQDWRAGRVTRRDPARIVSGMSGFAPSRVGRLTAEFSVIVIGVLVALFAESWWSERDQRRYEAEVREDMVEEFQVNLEILASDMATNDTMMARSRVLTESSDQELLAMPEEELDHWLDAAFYRWSLFDPYLGSAQALVQSGNLGVVSDRQLRLELSRWAGLLEESKRYGDLASTGLFEGIFPALADISADGVWSPGERMKFRTLAGQQEFLVGLVTSNHERLQQAARDILNYLESR